MSVRPTSRTIAALAAVVAVSAAAVALPAMAQEAAEQAAGQLAEPALDSGDTAPGCSPPPPWC